MATFKTINIGTGSINILVMDEWEKVFKYLNHPKTQKARESFKKKVFDFLDWFLTYANSVLPPKPYKEETMIPILFPLKAIQSQTNLISHFRYKTYILREYVNHLKSVMTQSNIDRYEHELLFLSSEMDYIICSLETLKNKAGTVYTPHIHSSYELMTRDILSAANELLFIEEAPDIANIYLRDLKPYVIFQIRQFIEIIGKNIIGYRDICNASTGESIHKFTQIAWEFIEAKNDKSTWKIAFPVDQNIIVRINKWSNRFVHSGKFTPNYMHAFLLKCLGKLLKPVQSPVTIYDRTNHQSLLYGDIKITKYNDLMNEFQSYIDTKTGGPGKAIIHWLPKDKVHAYIISL